MSKLAVFLTKEEEQEIVEAIRLAEKETSGEIRIHIEKTTSKDPFDRALEVFHLLEMDQTELKNGVLIYLAVEDKKFVICGDKGINELVEADFWDTTKNSMANHFKNSNFKLGLVEGITKVGIQLQKYFPFKEGDINELSNEISKG